MEKKRKTKIQKWDEVGGAVETEVETIGDSFDETPGTGPSVSRNPMWIVNTFLDNFFKVIFPILYWCLITK